MDVSERHERAQRQAEHSDWVDRIAGIGVVVYGLVHLLVAWLVLRLAFGDPAGAASGEGAFHQLARSTAGRVSLYGVAAGFFALVVWQGIEAVFGFRQHEGRQRVLNRLLSGAKVVLFAGIGVNALMVAAGSSSGGRGTDGFTARLMGLPAGPLLVGAVGLVIVVVAGCIAYYGLAENFRDMMSEEGETGVGGRTYRRLGKAGYVAKGLAIALVGGLFGYAAITHDPRKSGGLDQALHQVQQEPFGAPVLVVVALGLACFGLFCFALARHLDR